MPRFKLSSLFSITIFIIMLAAAFLTFLGIQLLIHFQILDIDYPMLPIFFFDLISILVGTIAASFISKNLLKPLHAIIDATEKITEGDYSTRLPFEDIQIQEFEQLGEKFNHMAEELGSVEMLRNDFINNFSHEFKTPIVSIAGFAKLLKRGKLSEEQKQEYLTVIEEESLRLADMATNVLNLTKVENQTILTDVTVFNLSEQLRTCVLLLERKWMKKEIEFSMDFVEHSIEANEELLKQIWLNLLDNAVKFSPQGGLVEISIKADTQSVRVSIMNQGDEIPEESQKRIFAKFYQADESHATEGNGIGLAVVKCITELHGGSVSVHSENHWNLFAVELPKRAKEKHR